MTVVLAEHRLERVIPFADRVVLVPGRGEHLVVGSTAEIMATSPVAPPIVELARLAEWSPVPLTVRDARRLAEPLRRRIATAPRPAPSDRVEHQNRPVATVERLSVTYGNVIALGQVDLAFSPGEVVAVMGRNGSGKSTLLTQLAGVRAPTGGRVRILDQAPVDLPPPRLIRLVGMVPQDAGVLLYGESVDDECSTADRETGLVPGTTAAMLDAVLPGVPQDHHPRDLSEGQRLALALAIVLAPRPPVVLLDEPTRGLDYPSKERLVATLRKLSADGVCVVLATHDVELVAQVATRAVVLAEGEVVSDGVAREVVCHSPVFAPQVAKVLSPEPWLTVDEVRTALATGADRG
jgi:energy-coupling factor transporter ATP-binding protein EcfA2